RNSTFSARPAGRRAGSRASLLRREFGPLLGYNGNSAVHASAIRTGPVPHGCRANRRSDDALSRDIASESRGQSGRAVCPVAPTASRWSRCRSSAAVKDLQRGFRDLGLLARLAGVSPQRPFGARRTRIAPRDPHQLARSRIALLRGTNAAASALLTW